MTVTYAGRCYTKKRRIGCAAIPTTAWAAAATHFYAARKSGLLSARSTCRYTVTVFLGELALLRWRWG